ncbi:MAG TPA: asparagine synthase-related protein [Gemmatimonadaceae bacterium]
MTGYAVVVRRDAARVAADELHVLMPSLRRRGPHGEQVVADGPVGIATALLDVGDPRLAPAWACDGSLLVAAQVRLDAREALVEALRWAGGKGDITDADIHLFAQAWRTWGDDAPSHLLGDFSAVIHDRESRTTTLVRDPFGVRMLFYHNDARRLIASNTLASLLDAGVSRELDEDAIADFISEGFNEDPSTTTFRAIRRVPPACLVTVHPTRRTEAKCYWTLPAPAIDRSRDAETIVTDFRILLEAAVRDRMRTPKLTVFMSGGLDSTTLAAIAARQDVHTQIVARTAHLPTLAPTDDTSRARLAAQHMGIPHVLSDVDEYGYRDGTALPIPDTLEPSGDPDFLSLHDELLRASEHAPVAFWGEDPDAYLSPPHLAELLRASAPHRFALDLIGHLLRERARPYLGVRALVRRRRAASRVSHEEQGGPPWLRADLRARRAERVRAREGTPHPTRSAAAERLAQYHWQPFLESLDAGFHGIPIDVRLPYLDLRLIHYALALPPMPWLQGKRLLREVARGLIPDAVREAPKQGMPGLYEARIAQWWAREPAPFVPSPAFARFVDVSKLPAIGRTTSVNDTLVHLRLRALDRWLRAE